jgi:hypothetical protein
MLRSNDQSALKQQHSLHHQQHQQPSAMMSLSDNWQQAQRLQQLQQLHIHQQLLSPTPTYHFQGDATGQRTQPSIPGLTSAHLDIHQYQSLQGIIAEEDHLLKLRQLRQLHDLQKYQDLAAQERVSGMTRSADFVTAASPGIHTLREPSYPRPMPEITDDSATTPFENEDETSVSPHKRKSKKKDTKWLITLGELKYYREAHGDCIVPRGYALNPHLASWVAEQR